MEATDIFGDEPESDELSEAPTLALLAEETAKFAREHGIDKFVDEHGTVILDARTGECPEGGNHAFTRNPRICSKCHQRGNDATEPQRKFVLDLIEKKELASAWKKIIAEKADGEAGLGFREASQIIDSLKKLSDLDKAKQPYPFVKPTPEELPAGRYAITDENNELKFYQVWRGSRNPDIIKVYIQHGPDDSEIPFRSAMVVCKRIVNEGPLVCAQRYGREIGSCYRCGLRLTNRVNRQLGIGPICGNRDFGDEFKRLESVARAEIIRAGHDPDEVIEIDSED